MTMTQPRELSGSLWALASFQKRADMEVPGAWSLPLLDALGRQAKQMNAQVRQRRCTVQQKAVQFRGQADECAGVSGSAGQTDDHPGRQRGCSLL
jgi:hypothetical protein